MATIIRYKNNLDVPTAVSKGEIGELKKKYFN